MSGDSASAITSPSEQAREQALATLPAQMGHMRDFAAWVAACQDAVPPRALADARMLAVSRGPLPALFDDSVLQTKVAAEVGVQLRAVVAEEGTENVGPMTGLQLNQAMEAGAAAVQNAVAEGADVLVAALRELPEADADATDATLVAALAIIGVLTRSEPVTLVDSPADVNVDEWKAQVVNTRNAMFRGRRLRHDPLGLLRTIGTPEIAALTSVFLEAAVTRTPLLFDGPIALAAAMLAHELSPKAKAWWLVGGDSIHAAQGRAMDALELEPALHVAASGDSGTASLAALQLLRTAVALAEQ